MASLALHILASLAFPCLGFTRLGFTRPNSSCCNCTGPRLLPTSYSLLTPLLRPSLCASRLNPPRCLHVYSLVTCQLHVLPAQTRCHAAVTQLHPHCSITPVPADAVLVSPPAAQLLSFSSYPAEITLLTSHMPYATMCVLPTTSPSSSSCSSTGHWSW